jgi:predicted GH43/DUF377 family glycosyl hydrolase
MSDYAIDRIVIAPGDIDLSRSPLAGHFAAETFVLGAFNPGMTRLPGGNIVLFVRVAEALREPIRDGHVHAVRWHDGRYVIDAWPLNRVDTTDPRTFVVRGEAWRVLALTSLSWILPVEMTPDGLEVVAVHYDAAIAPEASFQCYGVEDPRVSRLGDQWLMTTCSVSPERQCTTLYLSDDGLHFRLADIVLDHQNKDMLIFEGLVGGQFWAQTRPLGDVYFAYPPGSAWHAGPSINLATSPDGLHWKPFREPGIRPAAGSGTARIGGGAPPVLTPDGWLTLWHAVDPGGTVGIYRTWWSLLDRDEPWRALAQGTEALIDPDPALTAPLRELMYLSDVVFTTGIADGGDHWIVASGEADLACRITHVPKDRIG